MDVYPNVIPHFDAYELWNSYVLVAHLYHLDNHATFVAYLKGQMSSMCILVPQFISTDIRYNI